MPQEIFTGLKDESYENGSKKYFEVEDSGVDNLVLSKSNNGDISNVSFSKALSFILGKVYLFSFIPTKILGKNLSFNSSGFYVDLSRNDSSGGGEVTAQAFYHDGKNYATYGKEIKLEYGSTSIDNNTINLTSIPYVGVIHKKSNQSGIAIGIVLTFSGSSGSTADISISNFGITVSYLYNFNYREWNHNLGKQIVNSYQSDSLTQTINSSSITSEDYNFLGWTDELTGTIPTTIDSTSVIKYIPEQNYTFSKDEERILTACYNNKAINGPTKKIVGILPGKNNEFEIDNNGYERAYRYTVYSSSYTSDSTVDPKATVGDSTYDDNNGNRHFKFSKDLSGSETPENALNKVTTCLFYANLYNSNNSGIYYLNVETQLLEYYVYLYYQNDIDNSPKRFSVINEHYSTILQAPTNNKKFTLKYQDGSNVSQTSYNVPFLHYSDANGTTYAANAEIASLNVDLNLYGQWQNSMTIQITKANPTKEGYAFEGWSLNGSTKTYKYGDSIKVDTTTKEATLTATWTGQRTVIFDNDGANMGDFNITNMAVLPGDSITFPTVGKRITLTLDLGYDNLVYSDHIYDLGFQGWKIKGDNSGNLYQGGDSYIVNDNISFIASWKSREIGTDFEEVYRKGFEFVGWFTEDGKNNIPGSLSQDTTWYAHWRYIEIGKVPLKFLLGNLEKLDYLNIHNSIEDGIFYYTEDVPNLYLGNRDLSTGNVELANLTEQKAITVENITQIAKNQLGKRWSNRNKCNEFLIRYYDGSIGDRDFQQIVSQPEMTKILPYQFNNTWMTSIILPENITEIDYNGFEGCAYLKEIILPNTLTKIKQEAFYACTNLEKVIIPNSVTEIGYSCFLGCIQLKNVVLGNGISKIGFDTFYNCSNLSEINLPEGLLYIENSAFSHCRSLTSLIFPSSIQQLGENIFNTCTSLELLDFSKCTKVPDLGGQLIGDSSRSSNFTIKVPNSLLENWKTTTNWSIYGDYIIGV